MQWTTRRNCTFEGRVSQRCQKTNTQHTQLQSWVEQELARRVNILVIVGTVALRDNDFNRKPNWNSTREVGVESRCSSCDGVVPTGW